MSSKSTSSQQRYLKFLKGEIAAKKREILLKQNGSDRKNSYGLKSSHYFQIRPEWDGTITDQSRYRFNAAELEAKRKAKQSVQCWFHTYFSSSNYKLSSDVIEEHARQKKINEESGKEDFGEVDETNNPSILTKRLPYFPNVEKYTWIFNDPEKPLKKSKSKATTLEKTSEEEEEEKEKVIAGGDSPSIDQLKYYAEESEAQEQEELEKLSPNERSKKIILLLGSLRMIEKADSERSGSKSDAEESESEESKIKSIKNLIVWAKENKKIHEDYLKELEKAIMGNYLEFPN